MDPLHTQCRIGSPTYFYKERMFHSIRVEKKRARYDSMDIEHVYLPKVSTQGVSSVRLQSSQVRENGFYEIACQVHVGKRFDAGVIR